MATTLALGHKYCTFNCNCKSMKCISSLQDLISWCRFRWVTLRFTHRCYISSLQDFDLITFIAIAPDLRI